jgi:serine/threonine-protein kinase
MSDLADGAVVDGRYRIVRRIGSGGMADVYLAEDTHLGREIALKVLHRRFAQDAEFVERFRREASAAAGLQHPHVVGVFDRGEHEGTYYIAMEYLRGRTLKDVMVAEAPLDQLRVISIGEQILQAAGFAHRNGVVHRDFKPHNVIVDETGNVKVTDFGIARAGASEMTETGSIMGTAQYLSPEQAQGQEVTPRSDVYSIGVMLYELLTGNRAQAHAGTAAADEPRGAADRAEPRSCRARRAGQGARGTLAVGGGLRRRARGLPALRRGIPRWRRGRSGHRDLRCGPGPAAGRWQRSHTR